MRQHCEIKTIRCGGDSILSCVSIEQRTAKRLGHSKIAHDFLFNWFMISDINLMVLSPYSMVEATECLNPCSTRGCSGSLMDNGMFFTF